MLRRDKFAKYTTAADVAEFVAWIASAGELVTVDEPGPARAIQKTTSFALAVAGRADYLVSGDSDLLVLGRVGAIPIVKPADFLAAVNH